MNNDNVSQRKYKPTVSTIMLCIVAVLTLVSGIIMILSYFFSGPRSPQEKNVILVFGIATLFFAVIEYAIINLLDDVHQISYNLTVLIDNNNDREFRQSQTDNQSVILSTDANIQRQEVIRLLNVMIEQTGNAYEEANNNRKEQNE